MRSPSVHQEDSEQQPPIVAVVADESGTILPVNQFRGGDRVGGGFRHKSRRTQSGSPMRSPSVHQEDSEQQPPIVAVVADESGTILPVNQFRGGDRVGGGFRHKSPGPLQSLLARLRGSSIGMAVEALGFDQPDVWPKHPGDDLALVPVFGPGIPPTRPQIPDRPVFRARELTELERRANDAGGADGKLRCMLAWNSKDDLDLHCTTPSGAKIFFSNTRADGGELDVDQNASDERISDNPVENIVFENPRTGRYVFSVKNYRNRTGEVPTPYTVQLNQAGRTPQTRRMEDIKEDGKEHPIFEIFYDPDAEDDSLVYTDSRVRRDREHQAAFDAELKAWRDKRAADMLKFRQDDQTWNHSAAVLCVVPLPSMQQRLHRISMLLRRKRKLAQVAAIREDVWRYLVQGRKEMVKLEWERAIETFKFGLAKRHNGDLRWSVWSRLEHAEKEATEKQARRDEGRREGEQCLRVGNATSAQYHWEGAIAEISRGLKKRCNDAGHKVWSDLQRALDDAAAAQAKRDEARAAGMDCNLESRVLANQCQWEKAIAEMTEGLQLRCNDAGHEVWSDLQRGLDAATAAQAERDKAQWQGQQCLRAANAMASQCQWEKAIAEMTEGLQLRCNDAGHKVWSDLQRALDAATAAQAERDEGRRQGQQCLRAANAMASQCQWEKAIAEMTEGLQLRCESDEHQVWQALQDGLDAATAAQVKRDEGRRQAQQCLSEAKAAKDEFKWEDAIEGMRRGLQMRCNDAGHEVWPALQDELESCLEPQVKRDAAREQAIRRFQDAEMSARTCDWERCIAEMRHGLKMRRYDAGAKVWSDMQRRLDDAIAAQAKRDAGRDEGEKHLAGGMALAAKGEWQSAIERFEGGLKLREEEDAGAKLWVDLQCRLLDARCCHKLENTPKPTPYQTRVGKFTLDEPTQPAPPKVIDELSADTQCTGGYIWHYEPREPCAACTARAWQVPSEKHDIFTSESGSSVFTCGSGTHHMPSSFVERVLTKHGYTIGAFQQHCETELPYDKCQKINNLNPGIEDSTVPTLKRLLEGFTGFSHQRHQEEADRAASKYGEEHAKWKRCKLAFERHKAAEAEELARIEKAEEDFETQMRRVVSEARQKSFFGSFVQSEFDRRAEELLQKFKQEHVGASARAQEAFLLANAANDTRAASEEYGLASQNRALLESNWQRDMESVKSVIGDLRQLKPAENALYCLEDARVRSAEFKWEDAISSYRNGLDEIRNGLGSLPDGDTLNTIEIFIDIKQRLEQGEEQARKDKTQRDDNQQSAQQDIKDCEASWKDRDWKSASETVRTGLNRRCKGKDRGCDTSVWNDLEEWLAKIEAQLLSEHIRATKDYWAGFAAAVCCNWNDAIESYSRAQERLSTLLLKEPKKLTDKATARLGWIHDCTVRALEQASQAQTTRDDNRRDGYQCSLKARAAADELKWEDAIEEIQHGLQMRCKDAGHKVWSELQRGLDDAVTAQAKRDEGRRQGQRCLRAGNAMAAQCQWEDAGAEIKRALKMRCNDAGHEVWLELQSFMERCQSFSDDRDTAREQASRYLQDAEILARTCDWERCIDVAQRACSLLCQDADSSGVWSDLVALIKRANESQQRRDAGRVGGVKNLADGMAFAAKGEWQSAIERFEAGLKLREEEDAGEDVWDSLSRELARTRLDVEIRRLEAEIAKFGGELECRLSWTNTDDLDLYCETPCQLISFRKKRADGGQLAADVNADGSEIIDSPEETIGFQTARWGTYTFSVHNFRRRSTNVKTPFTVQLKCRGVMLAEKRLEDISEGVVEHVFTHEWMGAAPALLSVSQSESEVFRRLTELRDELSAKSGERERL